MDALVELVKGVIPATVFIHVRVRSGHPSIQTLGEERMGSGAIIDQEGSILTVNYVVLGAEEVAVALPDGRRFEGEVVGRDFESGLAVLRIPPFKGLPTLKLGSSLDLLLGQPVFIIASVGAAERRVSNGLVSYMGEFDAPWEYALEKAIMVTAPNPGFGGGSLFNFSGQIVGVVSLNLGEIARPTMAIPVELYQLHRLELLEFGTVISRPRRAWVGFYVETAKEGVTISGLVPGGPAEASGLKVGDVILALGSVSVGSRRDLYEELWKRKAGEVVRFRILREGALMTIQVRSGDREAFYR